MISQARQNPSKSVTWLFVTLVVLTTTAALQNVPEISVLSSSSAGVLLADIYGSVHVLNKDFESITSWVAHQGGRVTHMTDRKGVLVTIGVCAFTRLKQK